MNKNKQYELKDCPFCGSEAEFIKNNKLKGIHCSNPQCIAFDITAFYCHWKKAVKGWNNRINDEPSHM